MRLATKILLVLTCLLGLMIVEAVSSIRTLNSIENDLRRITGQTVATIQLVDEIRTLGFQVNGSAAEYAVLVSQERHLGSLAPDHAYKESLQEEKEERLDATDKLRKATAKYLSALNIQYPDQTNLGTVIAKDVNDLITAANNMIDAVVQPNPQQILIDQKEKLEQIERAFLTSTASARKAAISTLNQTEADAHRSVDRFTLLSWMALAATLLIVPSIGGYFAYSIARPLRSLSEASGEIARGNFRAAPIIQRRDEIGELSTAFQAMAADLNAHQTARRTAEDDLKNAYLGLEQTVKARTADLRQQIAERRKVEQDLITAKNTAEAASRAKTRFLAAASHDLRQPLQAITLYISALADTETAPAKLSIINKVSSSVDSVASLLNALLDISKLDAGLIVPDRKPFPIEQILGIVGEFDELANAQGVRVKLVESTAMVESDPALLETVLRNLIANAVKYTVAGRVSVGCRRRGDNLRIEVRDTGIGIAEDKRHLIFEEFYQVGNFARDREQGLGLGLSIVSRISALLGHKIELESVEGRGTTIAITLPMILEANPVVATNAPANIAL